MQMKRWVKHVECVEGRKEVNMYVRHCLILAVFFLSAICKPAICQEEIVEERLERLEAKVDSLINLFTEYLEEEPFNITVMDTPHVQFGVAGPYGTVLDKEYFVINYNDDWKIANWVAYYLSVDNLQGDTDRTNDFRPDTTLPLEIRADTLDYKDTITTGFKFDRGHLAPADAFKRSRDAMSTTFLLSNMAPQTTRLNRGRWRILEGEVRDHVRDVGEAWVVTGNVCIDDDSLPIDPETRIGENEVAVPSYCYKVILSRNDEGDISMFGFMLPNRRDPIPRPSTRYLLTVDRLEEITGYEFFPELEDELEDSLESIEGGNWPD